MPSALEGGSVDSYSRLRAEARIREVACEDILGATAQTRLTCADRHNPK